MLQFKSPGQPQQLCKCCLNPLPSKGGHVKTNKVLCEVFKKLINGHELEKGSVCIKCHEILTKFDLFQREIVLKHSTFEQLETREPEDKFEVKQLAKKTKVEKKPTKLQQEVIKPKPSTKAKPPPYQQSARIEPKHSASEFYLLPPKPLVLPKSPSFSKLHQSSSSETLSAEEDTDIKFTKSFTQQSLQNKNNGKSLTASVPLTREAIPVTVTKNNHMNMIKCAYCNTIAANRDYIVKHIEEKHRIPCRQNCGRFFITEKDLDNHMKDVHDMKFEVKFEGPKDDGKRKKLLTMNIKSTAKAQKNNANARKGSLAGKSILPD